MPRPGPSPDGTGVAYIKKLRVKDSLSDLYRTEAKPDMLARAIALYRESARSRRLDDEDIPYRKDLQRIGDIRLASLVHERYSPQSFPEELLLLSFEHVLALGALSGVLKDEPTKTEAKERDKIEWLIELSGSNATGEQPISGIPQGEEWAAVKLA